MTTENNLRGREQTEDHWISISDLMAGLMILFIFIAIAYMVKIRKQNEGLIGISETYSNEIAELYKDLYDEFEDDIPKWNIEIDSLLLIIRFKEPDVLFRSGSDSIRIKFTAILDDFFPRYVGILTSTKHINNIDEIRIEGHTSAEGKVGMTDEESYFYNMDLSQSRTSNVLDYVLRETVKDSLIEWTKKHLVAVGYSSSKLIEINKVENREKSRRVEFRVFTKAHERILQLLKLGRQL